jgi:pyrroloquinoline-quinone synthase
MERHYPWVPAWGLDYFRNRLTQQPKDIDHVLRLVLGSARTLADQQACVAALQFKCEVLWALLDAVGAAFSPTLPPASAP